MMNKTYERSTESFLFHATETTPVEDLARTGALSTRDQGKIQAMAAHKATDLEYLGRAQFLTVFLFLNLESSFQALAKDLARAQATDLEGP